MLGLREKKILLTSEYMFGYDEDVHFQPEPYAVQLSEHEKTLNI